MSNKKPLYKVRSTSDHGCIKELSQSYYGNNSLRTSLFNQKYLVYIHFSLQITHSVSRSKF